MDGFSLIVGGMLGALAGWAFSAATAKQREASKRSNEALKAEQKMLRMKGEAKSNKAQRVSELMHGFLLYIFGLMLIAILTMILFGSLV